MTKYFPRKRDNWSNQCSKESNKDQQITAYTNDNGQTYQTREHVYVSMDKVDNPYGIAFIHNFKVRRDVLYMDIRWYYRFRDLPLQLQSKIDVDIRENRAQCHSCTLTGDDYQTDSNKDEDNSSQKPVIRFKSRELFASEILDTCLASFIVGRCCIVCYRDIEEAVDFRPFVDTFYYLFTYNPHHRRLAATQGEIRIGIQYQADIPDLNVSDECKPNAKTCCNETSEHHGPRARDDISSEIKARASAHDENTNCSESSVVKRRKLWSGSGDDTKRHANSNSVDLPADDDIKEECSLWCANLALERVDELDFQAYTMAVRSIAIFSNTCEEGSVKSITDDDTHSSPLACEYPWRHQRVPEDFVTQFSFDALHNAKYDFAKALDIIGSTPIISPLRKSWTEDDQKRFQRGIRQLGKNFYQIQKECLPEKSLNEVIEFYYMWKKSSQGQIIRPKRRLKPMLQRRIRQSNGSSLAYGEKTDRLITTPNGVEIEDQTASQQNDCIKSEHLDATSASRCVNCFFLPFDSSELRSVCINNDIHQLYCSTCLDHYKRYGYVPIDDMPVLDFDESSATGRLKDAMNSLLMRAQLCTTKDNIKETIKPVRRAITDLETGESTNEVAIQDLSVSCLSSSPLTRDVLDESSSSTLQNQHAVDVESGFSTPISLMGLGLQDESVSPVKSMEKMVLQATGDHVLDSKHDTLTSERICTDPAPREIGSDPIMCNVELFRSVKYRLVRILDRGQNDSCSRTDIVCASRSRVGSQRRMSNDGTERQYGKLVAKDDLQVEKEFDYSSKQCATESTKEICGSKGWVKFDSSHPDSSSRSQQQSSPFSSGRATRASGSINCQSTDPTRSDSSSTSTPNSIAMLTNLHPSRIAPNLVQSDVPALHQLREMALARSSKYTERKALHHMGRNSNQSGYRNRKSSPISAQLSSVVGISNHQQQQTTALALQQYMQMALEAGLSNNVQNDIYNNALVQSFLHSHGQAALQNPYIMSQIAGLAQPNCSIQRPSGYDFGSLIPMLADGFRLHPSNGHSNRRHSPLSRDLNGSTHNHAHLHAHSHTHLHLNDRSPCSTQSTGGMPGHANQSLPQLMANTPDRLDHSQLQFAAPSTNSTLSSVSSNPFLAAAFQQSGQNPGFGSQEANPPANFDFGMFASTNNFLNPFRNTTVSSSNLQPSHILGSDNSASQMLLAAGTPNPLDILQAMGYPSIIPNSAYSEIGNNQASVNHPTSTLFHLPQFDVQSTSNVQPPWYQQLSGSSNYHHSSNQQQALLHAAFNMRSAGVPPEYPYHQLFQYQQQHQMLMGTTSPSYLGGLGTSQVSPGLQPLIGYSQAPSLAPTFRLPPLLTLDQSQGVSEGRVRCARSPLCHTSGLGDYSPKHSTLASRRPSSQHPFAAFTQSDGTYLHSNSRGADSLDVISTHGDDIGRNSLNNTALSKRRRIDDSQRVTDRRIDGKQSE